MTPRIHFFPKGGRWLASSRYRVFHLAEELEALGRSCSIHQPPRVLRRYLAYRLGHRPTLAEVGRIRLRETLRNTRALAGVREGEIILAQRSVYSRSFAAMMLALRRGKTIIFDIDDAVYEGQAETTNRMISGADLVVAGSHELADYARRSGARDVYLFPTSVPLANYPLKQYRSDGSRPTIGWMGTGPEHLENIRILRAPLVQLAKQMDFLFLFVGTLYDPALTSLLDTFEGVSIEIVPTLEWADPAAVISTLHRFDVGLMPLTDTLRHRAKCAFKAIESMACGIPVVVSRVGENSHLVADGEEGFLAGSQDEWCDKLALLLRDERARREMGRRAREKVERGYDLKTNAAAFDRYLCESLRCL